MQTNNGGDTIPCTRNQAHRLPYATPQLISYGAVSALTAAGSGLVSELNPLGPCTGIRSQQMC